MTNFLNVEVRAGDPIAIGDRTVTPFAQSFQIKFPGMNGGLIWNRPVSILVQTNEGEECVLAVPDVTRQLIWTLAAMSIITALLGWLITKLFRK